MPEQPQTRALAVAAPRLPYPADAAKFGYSEEVWRVLTDAIFPNAKTATSVILALSYCKARKLDILKRPVHIVPVWDSKKRVEVETIWPGIGELRTTAARTGQYAGMDDCVFGPDVTHTFEGEGWADDEGGDGERKKTTQQVTVTFPEWAQVTVYRIVNGQRCPFVGPKVWWLEAYATRKAKSDLPNTMWETRARGQIEKCAEAAGLRRAFPEECSDYTAEEMEGQEVEFRSDGRTPEGVELMRPRARGDAPYKPEAKKPERPAIDRSKLERVLIHGVEKKAGKSGRDTFPFWLVAYETEKSGRKDAGTRDEELAKVATGLKGDFALIAVEELEKGVLKLLHVEAAPAAGAAPPETKAEGPTVTEVLFPQGDKQTAREPGED